MQQGENKSILYVDFVSLGFYEKPAQSQWTSNTFCNYIKKINIMKLSENSNINKYYL